MKKRHKKTTIIAAALLLAAAALQLAARGITGFADLYSQTVYPVLVGVIGRIFSILPFSVVEIGLYLLILSALVGITLLLIRMVRRRITAGQAFLAAGRTLFLAAAALLFSYTAGCGINYYRTPFSAEAGFLMEESGREELASLCRLLASQINEAAKGIETDSEGCLILTEDAEETARRAMEALGERYESLRGYYPQPKGLLFSRLLSVQKIEGVYSPFTLEANYNQEMPEVNIPSTLCHELSHLRGFMREDEANFIAYLACLESGDPSFVYSGAILAFIHSGNALYANGGQEEYFNIYNSLCDTAKRDMAADSAFWRQFDGPVAEASSQVNDAYLKANSQEDGVRSYGRMVDLLLAFYRERG